MGKLIYSAIASADGYVEDAAGEFTWAEPDDDVLRLVNDLERPVGTYLYGRRMYETMAPWETMPGDSPPAQEFAGIWRAAEKMVYSRTLTSVSIARTRVERDFNPDSVRRLVKSAERDVSVGGAGLAGQALTAGLVDELQLILLPVLVGGGKRALPDGARLDLKLLETRQFPGGTVFLRYAVLGHAVQVTGSGSAAWGLRSWVRRATRVSLNTGRPASPAPSLMFSPGCPARRTTRA